MYLIFTSIYNSANQIIDIYKYRRKRNNLQCRINIHIIDINIINDVPDYIKAMIIQRRSKFI